MTVEEQEDAVRRRGDIEEDEPETVPHDPLETDRLLPSSGPNDNYKLVYVMFYLLGMATLLPWNFFISVNSFWDYKFRDVNETNPDPNNQTQTELQKEFTSYLAIASNVPNAIFVILNAIFGQRFPLKFRLMASLGSVIVFFSIVTVFSRVDSDSWQETFLVVVLLLVIFINVCTAIYQGGLFGVAGKFPPRYMGAVMAGQAMGGVFPSLVDILFVSVKIEEKDVGFACFLVATMFLIIGFLTFHMGSKTAFFDHFANAWPTLRQEENREHLRQPAEVATLTILGRSWQYCISVWLTFTITLAVFPAVTVLVESQYLPDQTTWAVKYFTPVTCFLFFNTGDYVGRLISTAMQWPSRTPRGSYMVLGLSLARLVFIPLFMLCNAAPTKRILPVVFHSDAVYVLFMIVFALSNGYLGNMCMLQGPKTSGSSEDQEATAMLLVAFLVLGTGTGSFLSYLLVSFL